MTPQEYAAVIKYKAKYGNVFLQQDGDTYVICRGLTIGEVDAMRSTIKTLNVDDMLLLQSIFELTCVYPEDTSTVSLKASVALAKQVLEDVKEESHTDEEQGEAEELLKQSGQPIFYYKLLQSLPVSVGLRNAAANNPQTQKHEIRKGIFIEN